MDVVLTPELERFVEQKMQTGSYQDRGEVLREALQVMKQREELRQAKLEDLRREITIGIEQAKRGESAPLDIEAIIAEARTEFEKRKE